MGAAAAGGEEGGERRRESVSDVQFLSKFLHVAMPSILSSHTLPFYLNFQCSIKEGWKEMGLSVRIAVDDPGRP